MNPLQLHMQFYDTVVNPYADDATRRLVIRRFISEREAKINDEVQTFWRDYIDSKLEHGFGIEHEENAHLLSDFDRYYFPIGSLGVELPEAKQILLDQIPLFYIDNYLMLNRMYYAAQWTSRTHPLYGYYPPPEQQIAEEIYVETRKNSRDV